MNRPSQYVDISTFPPGEQAHIIDLAKRHNALAEDVDAISGNTLEEKIEMHEIFAQIRKWVHYLHERRFSISLLTLEVGFIIFILDRLGIDTRTFIPDFIHVMQALSN